VGATSPRTPPSRSSGAGGTADQHAGHRVRRVGRVGHAVGRSICSALPWSATTRAAPPRSARAASTTPSAASATSQARTAASSTPVWPTMSGLAKLIRTKASSCSAQAPRAVGRELGRAHLRLQVVGGDLRRRHQVARLAGVRGLVHGVEEVGDVRVLLGLGRVVLREAGVGDHLRQRLDDLRQGEREGGVEGRVELHQRREAHRGHPPPVEADGVGPAQERVRQLARAVRAEVEHQHAVAVLDAGGASSGGHDRRRDELVRLAARVGGRDGLGGVGGAVHGDPVDHGVPGQAGAFPAAVAVHRVVATDDGADAGRAAEVGDRPLQPRQVAAAAVGRGVAAVREGVDGDPRDATASGQVDQADQVAEVGVDAAVGHQAQQVERAPVAGDAVAQGRRARGPRTAARRRCGPGRTTATAARCGRRRG
jgi:hypothetical protein